MLSLNAASTHYVVVRHFCLDTSSRACTPLLLVAGRRTRRRIRGVVSALNLDSSIGSFGSFLGIAGVGGRMCCTVCGVSGVVRRCKGKWESEGDLDAGVDLEAEILEFMRNSENPHLFPNKKQLIDAGRLDLVEAIMRQGGWLSLGWDFDSEEESMVQDDCDFRGFGSPKLEFDYGALQERTYRNQESRTLEGNGGTGFSVSSSNSSSSASSSQGSIESVFNGNIGIEGILSGLEKERNVTFGVGLREKGNGNNVVHHGQGDWPYRAQADETAARSETSSESTSLNSLGPEAWRTWSAQRVGLGNSNFEAAEIHSTANRINEDTEFIEKDILNFREGNSAPVDGTKESSAPAGELNTMNIKDRLQHLELELSSVLSSLRSKSDADKRESLESISGDLQKLSDACEFQENEIMKAKDQLRSTRARLAVLEGKMSLAITDAHKIVEEKQRRIDDAHRALQLLRTICIVWPNSASEVLLAGSFDGWTTQRKMEKSSTGIFSLCLKLYSGKYEIKFIVDGEWKVDPLRPIVHNNGYENNLLIIT